MPTAGEVMPEIKRAATSFLEAGGSWSEGGGVLDSLRTAGVSLEVAATAALLQPGDVLASTLRVVYPQYAGIGPESAAVIVLFDQLLQRPTLAQPAETTRQMALDIRLKRDIAAGTAWTVEKINPLTSLGSPVPLTAAASSVLSNPRITLSEPARLDIGSGRINNNVLQIMLRLADRFTYAVQVMHTGHIQTVFPHPRLSNHAVGRAVDIREINGRRVVDDPDNNPTIFEFVTEAALLGATEVGGPTDLNGDRPGFFTDDVHSDHIHIGITPGNAPAHLR
jgi:hypothetical protein